jgi:hypothetical protein
MLRFALVLVAAFSAAAQDVSREDALRALRRAAAFYNETVSPHGAYHFAYTEDLSYGRSESADSPTRPEVQREGTPSVGDAFLRAWDVTGDRYYLEAARRVAHAYAAGQLCSGGWDYSIEFDPAKRKQFAYRADNNCGGGGVTSLDDNVTQAAIRYVMRVDRELNFEDKKVHEAAEFALSQLMKAQYPNGAWPQRYREFPDPAKFPVKRASYPESWARKWPGPNYQDHYTFNDNSIVDMIDTMLEAARIYRDPAYLASAEKGGEFILLSQMPDPQPAWAQQYDAGMHPAWARIFEPPSVTGGESQGVMRMLLVLYRETGDRKYLEPIPRALRYFKNSVLKPEQVPERRRRGSAATSAGGTDLGNWKRGGGIVLARFYELKTNRPLYITKGTRVGVRGEGTKLMDGYEISYSPASVITHYGVVTSGDWLPAIEADYKAISAAPASSLRRPDRLRGLSPWSERPARTRPAGEIAPQVKAAIAAMDHRGAWVEDGVIGKADRLLLVFAAKDMVVTVGGRTMPLNENETLEIFQGPQPPRERVVRTTTFHANVALLCEYLAALKP